MIRQESTGLHAPQVSIVAAVAWFTKIFNDPVSPCISILI
jgi:hypothetical protein